MYWFCAVERVCYELRQLQLLGVRGWRMLETGEEECDEVRAETGECVTVKVFLQLWSDRLLHFGLEDQIVWHGDGEKHMMVR